MATVTGIHSLSANGTGSAVLSLNGAAPDGTLISANLTYAINMVDKAGTAYARSMDPGTTAIATVSAR
jgi:hypothetical protein